MLILKCLRREILNLMVHIFKSSISLHVVILQSFSRAVCFQHSPSFQWKCAVHGKLRRRMHTKVSTWCQRFSIWNAISFPSNLLWWRSHTQFARLHCYIFWLKSWCEYCGLHAHLASERPCHKMSAATPQGSALTHARHQYFRGGRESFTDPTAAL